MKRRAFSLVEILVVLVIIAILAAILIPRYLTGGKDANGKKVLAPRERAQQTAGISYVSQIQQAIMMYKMDNEEHLPPSLQDLKKYGVTAEMLLEPVSKQPLLYNPQTGEVKSPTPLPGSVDRALNLQNQGQ